MVSFRFRADTGSSTGGRIAASVFLIVFSGFGVFFLYLMGRDLAGSIEQRGTWKPVPCEIVRSEVIEERTSPRSNKPYLALIEYRYAYEGREFPSRTWRIALDDYTRAREKADRFSAGSTATCYVNPGNPSEAVIEREGLWLLPFLAIPLAFVVFGLGGLWAVWCGRWSPEKKKSAISREINKDRRLSRGCGCLFFLAGFGFFLPFTAIPMYRILTATGWEKTPCRILSSHVQSHSDSDGTTYSVDVFYEYEYGGEVYRSSRYDLVGGSSSGRSGKQKIVDRYPPDSAAVCYVNPARPSQAVLNPGFSPILLFGLIPVLFMGIGALVFLQGGRDGGEAALGTVAADYAPQSPHDADYGPVTLKPSAHRWIGFLMTFLFGGVFIGAEVFLVKQYGEPGGPPIFFPIVFGIAALIAAGAIVHQFLALFNPRVEIVADTQTPVLGQTFGLRYSVQGNSSRVQRLEVALEGIEEATYQRGTKSHTERKTFHRIVLVDAYDSLSIMGGTAEVTIPRDTMHSWRASNNKIIWKLVVKGDIPRWADLKEEFEITVRPLEIPGQERRA